MDETARWTTTQPLTETSFPPVGDSVLTDKGGCSRQCNGEPRVFLDEPVFFSLRCSRYGLARKVVRKQSGFCTSLILSSVRDETLEPATACASAPSGTRHARRDFPVDARDHVTSNPAREALWRGATV